MLHIFDCAFQNYFGCNDYDLDNIAPWTVQIMNHAPDIVSLRVVMFLRLKTGALQEWGHVVIVVPAPVLGNHRNDKALDDKIRHVGTHRNLLSLGQ